MSGAQASTLPDEPITAPQRRALFACAKCKGLDIDDLRALTPCGSISALSRQEAAELLSRLNAGTDYDHPRPARRGVRRPKGVYRFATDAQRRKITALGIDLGWTSDRLHEWLSERHFLDGRPMSKILDKDAAVSTKDGADVIELLKVVNARSARKRAREREASTPSRVSGQADATDSVQGDS
ncbi:MAG: hypothetical protein ACE5EX_10235 [Phycisphaerae bacterium]